MSSLRVLVAIDVPINKTGSGVVAKNLIREQIRLGYDIFLIAADYEEFASSEVRLPTSRTATVLFNHRFTTRSMHNRVSFPIPTFSDSMPFAHCRFGELTKSQIAEYLRAFEASFTKSVAQFRPHIIHTHHLFLLNVVARTVAPNIPLVSHAHGTELKFLQADSSFLPMVASSARAVDRILCVSNSVAQDAVRILNVLPERVTKLHNAVDTKRFKPMDVDREGLLNRFGIIDTYDRLVLYVGRFSAWKGIEHLIAAASIYSRVMRNFRVLTLIAGGGSKEAFKRYERRIEALDLKAHVKLVDTYGHPRTIIAVLMNCADVFVLPSIEEPFGLVLLEAMACGCPVVAARRGGPAEMIRSDFIARRLAHLVAPLRIEPVDKHEQKNIRSYQERLAEAVCDVLGTEPSHLDRDWMSNAVPTWCDVAQSLHEVYVKMILEGDPGK